MLRNLSWLLVLIPLASVAGAQQTDEKPDRWAKDMAKFAKQDAEHPTPQGGVVLVGSSSIRLWDPASSFPQLDPPPLNRGFGGSHLEDSIRHAELLILKHKPRVVVVYAGDNDLAAGKTAERVADDFAKLASTVGEQLPNTRIAYIAIKPSLARWNLSDTIKDANARIAKQCEEDDRLVFVDIWTPMLGKDGKPRAELLRKDGLHMTDEGYKLWTSLVTPIIEQEPADDTAETKGE